MKKSHTLVSIIIPSYNCDNYLGECIESILAQEYTCYEVIVVDDGSVDQTYDLVKSFHQKVKYIHQNHQGLTAALNRGITEAKGEYLAFIDSDDLWTKNKLKVQMEYLETYPKCDMVFSYIHQFFSNDISIERKKKIKFDEIVPGYLASCMLIKKEIFLKIGFFNNEHSIGHFIDWYMKAIDKGYTASIIKEVLYLRRIHNRNMGLTRKDEKYRYATVLKHALDRRRKL